MRYTMRSRKCDEFFVSSYIRSTVVSVSMEGPRSPSVLGNDETKIRVLHQHQTAKIINNK